MPTGGSRSEASSSRPALPSPPPLPGLTAGSASFTRPAPWVLEVKGLGKKSFEQAAGFLRVYGGPNPLDRTAIHPESYPAALKLQQSWASDIARLGEASDQVPPMRPAVIEQKQVTTFLRSLEISHACHPAPSRFPPRRCMR